MRRLPCGDDHPCYFQFPGHDGLQPGESYLVRMLNGPARNIAVTPATGAAGLYAVNNPFRGRLSQLDEPGLGPKGFCGLQPVFAAAVPASFRLSLNTGQGRNRC